MEKKQICRLFDILDYQKKNYPLSKALVSKKNGIWEPISTQQYIEKTFEVAQVFLNYGIKKGDKIALITQNNCPFWHILDIGIQRIGAVSVPVYATISEEDYAHIFSQTKAKICLVSDTILAEKINNIHSKLPHLEKIISWEETSNSMFSWKDFAQKNSLEKVDFFKISDLSSKIQKEDLATIIYTSGTTGLPKGVMLSHQNILSNVLSVEYAVPGVAGQDRVLSFLPVCHIYERMLLYLYQYLGFEIFFAESLEKIADNAREIQPQFFSTVPRVLEKVYLKILEKGSNLKGISKILFFWALDLAKNYDLKGKSFLYHCQLFIARKLIFKKWQAALGGKIKALISGSAAINPLLMRIFWAAGIVVLEGYGLTETSPVIAVNTKEKIRFGSVGPIIPGVEVKIADDGEILVKSPGVMMGYYENPEKTTEVFDAQGFFETGDIGKIEEGFLVITDRKKEIFKTSGGKYIAPQLIENTCKQSPFVEQIMVFGENQKFPAALIWPNFSTLVHWAQKNKIIFQNNAELLENNLVYDKIFEEIEKINLHLGQWEKIKKIVLIATPLTIDSGLITPTLKLKRKLILGAFKEQIEAIYKES